MKMRMTPLLVLILLPFFAAGCDWSQQRGAGQREKGNRIESGVSLAEVERALGKSEPVPPEPDRWCEAAGGTRRVRCLLCDSAWDKPHWWPSGSSHLEYLVICLDAKDRVAKTSHLFVALD